jgi:hypothetical protein
MLAVRSARPQRSAHESATKNVAADATQEASRLFNIPVAWLQYSCTPRAMAIPNPCRTRAPTVFMQRMPATYQELRAQHSLGTNSFAPRDKVLAGAVPFLRHVSPGFLTADNAAPRR